MQAVPKNNNNSIDRNQGELNNYLLLAENIPKYPCCFKEIYPPACAPDKCGRWRSMSKVMKLKPESCKRRWKTLRKHFGLGLLTNRQLIDKLQFLKDVAKEIPVTELRNNFDSFHIPVVESRNNFASSCIPIVESRNNFTPSRIPVAKTRNNVTSFRSNTSSRYIPRNPIKSYNLRSRTSGSAGTCIARMRIYTRPIGMNSIIIRPNEENVSQQTKVAKLSEHAKDILNTEITEDCDSDVQIIEPYIETIVVDD